MIYFDQQKSEFHKCNTEWSTNDWINSGTNTESIVNNSDCLNSCAFSLRRSDKEEIDNKWKYTKQNTHSIDNARLPIGLEHFVLAEMQRRTQQHQQ